MYSDTNINRFRTVSKEEPDDYQMMLLRKQDIENEFKIIKEKYDNVMTKLANFEKVDDHMLDECIYFESIDEYYKNPKCLPIDELTLFLENGDSLLEISAISSYWTESWNYGYYEESISISNLAKLSEGFQWLSNLPFYRFWSQILLVKNTIKAIKSFTGQNNLYFESLISDVAEYNKYYAEIYHSNYKILLKLVQTEVSPMEKLSVGLHTALIQGVFSYDMILSICKHYGYDSRTKGLLQQLFQMNVDLRTNGLALIGIECNNVLPFLSDSLNKLSVMFRNNPQQIHTVLLLLLNFMEEFCTIKSLLTCYPPFRFVVQYLQIEQQLIDYIGSHLFIVGKILRKITAKYAHRVNHSLLWTKFHLILKEVISIYRIFINETIEDVENTKLNSNDGFSTIRLQKSTKRYVQLLRNIFEYTFLAKHYVFMFDVQHDNQRLIRVFSDLSEFDRKTLDELASMAEKLRNTLQVQPGVVAGNDRTNCVPPDTFQEVYGGNLKFELIRAITIQLKLENARREANYDASSDELDNLTEQCLIKGLIRGFNDSNQDGTYQLHIGTNVPHLNMPLTNMDVDVTAQGPEDKKNTQKIFDSRVERLYRRLIEKQNKVTTENGFGDVRNTEPEAINGSAQYTDNDADMEKAISESLKEPEDVPAVDVVFQSLISEVKDILPHLGEGFITECLKHFQNNTEETISAILEQKLPSNLASLDQSLPIIPPETEKPKRTVFDGDEFDRMTRSEFDPMRIFRKKNKVGYRNASEMLNDKSHIKNTAEIYEQYSLDYYDDDFDDETDEGGLKEREIEAAEDIEPIRKNLNARLIEEESSDDSDEDSGATKPTNAFCEDPAVLRARAEERRNQKYQKKGGHKPPAASDVVGKPKGQGQEKSVLQNRAKKNENKSQKGNHNRRSGAQWKRSRGMIPS